MAARREPTRSNVIPFRIPASQDADPKLPPASSGRVVAFRVPAQLAWPPLGVCVLCPEHRECKAPCVDGSSQAAVAGRLDEILELRAARS